MKTRPGGIARLTALIDRRWGALEADFHATYGIDDLARAIYQEQMSFRWFAVRVNGLPGSARIWRDENGGWSVTDHLLADLIDAVRSTRAAFLASVTTPPGQRMKLDFPRYPRPTPKQPEAEGDKRKGGWAKRFARQMTGGGEQK